MPWLAMFVLLGACAPAAQPAAVPTPAQVSVLEAQLSPDSSDLRVLVPLGASYRASDRPGDARVVLEQAVREQPNDPGAVLYLGLTYEDLGLYTEAKHLYQRYLEVGRSADLKPKLRRRIPLLERQEMAAAVRNALAQEAELANTPPQPRTVAVFPFLYLGNDPELEPLSLALAEMLVTDLSQTDRLTVLERARVQMLLDEMELAERGRVDPATGARSGRLLGAGRIVQGRIDGTESRLRLQAAVVGTRDSIAGPPVSEEDAVRRLFEMQKRLALGIYRSLGVELTPAERERVRQQPTTNLEALLAYGRGIQAWDAGNFADAAEHFARAAALDPNFALAQQRGAASADLAQASATPTSQLAQAGIAELPAPVLQDLAGAGVLDAVETLVPSPGGRDPAVEVLGREGIGRRAILDIIFRRP